jgi:hypothetical protein
MKTAELGNGDNLSNLHLSAKRTLLVEAQMGKVDPIVKTIFRVQ